MEAYARKSVSLMDGCVAVMYFSWSPRKVPKEGDLRGHSEKACPLKKPLRRFASQRAKMFRFLNAYISKSLSLHKVDIRKSEHFRVSNGEAAGEVHRRGRIFVAPLLCRVLWLLSWRDKKVTLLHPLRKQCMILHKIKEIYL